MARKKRSKALRYFVLVTLVSAASFIFYLGYLWWRSKQLEFVRYPEFGIPVPQDYQIHGIDVSRYQQLISWDAVSEMQVQNIRIGFAFIKATEGISNTDSYFRQNWRNAKRAGLVRGAYHFFLATKDGKKQAENYIDKVELVTGDLPPVLDVEHTFGVAPDRFRKELQTWLDVIEKYYGVRPIIYTYVDFYNQNLKGFFDQYPLWVAHYVQQHQPRIDRDWTFWQHNEAGHVDGILSKVDFDVFNGDSTQFRSLLVP